MLEDRVAIVTGAARGIGLEIGRQLAAAGARVALVDLDVQTAERSAETLRREGLAALGVGANVAQVEQVQAMAKRVLGEWGQVDILVNNAGICPIRSIEETTPEEWDLVLGVNLKAAFFCSQALIPSMRERSWGKIVNIASSAGQIGGVAVGVHYAASKAGLFGLTKTMARMLAPEVQGNAANYITGQTLSVNGGFVMV
jgi:3-oxoacyl-[acyl-carrier protein] reductase